MAEIVKYNNIDVSFRQFGCGNKKTLVLLHGYLESKEIWHEFAIGLGLKYRVVCIDIPGHGASGVFDEVNDMDSLAAAVDEVMLYLGIEKFHLVGHSMGGYVSMAYLDLFPEKLNSLVLFHSTCFADTEEKRANRKREISLIQEGKKDLIVNKNIPMAFADDNLEALSEKVEAAKKIAIKTDDEGIISILNGMMERPDRSQVLANTDVPVMIVAGMKDNYIPREAIEKMKALNKRIKVSELEESGHMGFVEEGVKALEGLNQFFKSC